MRRLRCFLAGGKKVDVGHDEVLLPGRRKTPDDSPAVFKCLYRPILVCGVCGAVRTASVDNRLCRISCVRFCRSHVLFNQHPTFG